MFLSLRILHFGNLNDYMEVIEMPIPSETLRGIVLYLLEEANTCGLTKSELLQKTRERRDRLNSILEDALRAFDVVARQARKARASLGRQPTRYWLARFAPTDLTAPTIEDIPQLDLEPGASLPDGDICRQCGRAMPDREGPGRPLVYCSDACAHLAKAGSVTVADFMARAADPRIFAQLARLLVWMDLLCRGYRVVPAVEGGALIVYDEQSAAVVNVVPISESGYFPPADEYDSMAAVYRDGRIVYGGRNSLVPPPEKIEDAPVT